jgi:hypothetical protein
MVGAVLLRGMSAFALSNFRMKTGLRPDQARDMLFSGNCSRMSRARFGTGLRPACVGGMWRDGRKSRWGGTRWSEPPRCRTGRSTKRRARSFSRSQLRHLQPVLQGLFDQGIEQAGRAVVRSLRARIGLRHPSRPPAFLPRVLLLVAGRSESRTGVEAGGVPLRPVG